MHWVYLPFLRQGNTLDEVLEQMEVLDSRAVVIEFEFPHLELYQNDSVLRAWADGATYAKALAEYEGVRLAFITGWQLSVQGSQSVFTAFETALDKEDAPFGIPFMPDRVPGPSLVITRHERYADTIRGLTRKCVCRPNRDIVPTKKGVGDACEACDDGTYTRCR